MSKYKVATFFALISVIINLYLIYRARQPGGMPKKQHGRWRVVSGISLVIAFIVITFGQFLGLE